VEATGTELDTRTREDKDGATEDLRLLNPNRTTVRAAMVEDTAAAETLIVEEMGIAVETAIAVIVKGIETATRTQAVEEIRATDKDTAMAKVMAMAIATVDMVAAGAIRYAGMIACMIQLEEILLQDDLLQDDLVQADLLEALRNGWSL
jgi:hypothetical protein